MVLRDPKEEVNPSWQQLLVLFFLFLLLGRTDNRVSGSVACHYPLQWHNAPTLASKTILHDNGLQSVHCEILALNFSPEEVMGSHLSSNHSQRCVLKQRVLELEGKTYNESNNFYLLLKTCLKIVDYPQQAKRQFLFFMLHKQGNRLCVRR